MRIRDTLFHLLAHIASFLSRGPLSALLSVVADSPHKSRQLSWAQIAAHVPQEHNILLLVAVALHRIGDILHNTDTGLAYPACLIKESLKLY